LTGKLAVRRDGRRRSGEPDGSPPAHGHRPGADLGPAGPSAL